MNKNSPYAEFDLLVCKLLDQILSEEEVAKLEELILSNPDLKKRYLSFITQESLLHWETGSVVEFAEEVSVAEKPVFMPWVASIAAGIVALLCAWGFNQNFTEKFEVSTPPLEVVADSDLKILTSAQNISLESASSNVDYSVPFQVDLPGLLDTNAKKLASRAILLLENNVKYEQDAFIDGKEGVLSWNRSKHLSVPAENGILPYEGSEMVKLSDMTIDVDTQTASVHETLQVLDVRKLSSENNAKVDAQIYLNSWPSKMDSTEFELSVHALQGGVSEDKKSVAFSSTALNADSQHDTWERLESQLDLPKGTDFLVVAISARAEGPDALLPNANISYADSLRVNLTTSSGKTIGPL